MEFDNRLEILKDLKLIAHQSFLTDQQERNELTVEYNVTTHASFKICRFFEFFVDAQNQRTLQAQKNSKYVGRHHKLNLFSIKISRTMKILSKLFNHKAFSKESDLMQSSDLLNFAYYLK